MPYFNFDLVIGEDFKVLESYHTIAVVQGASRAQVRASNL